MPFDVTPSTSRRTVGQTISAYLTSSSPQHRESFMFAFMVISVRIKLQGDQHAIVGVVINLWTR
jgi:hypothetical protein